VTTPLVRADEALVSIETRLVNDAPAQNSPDSSPEANPAATPPAEVRATVVTAILDERGEEVVSVRTEEVIGAGKDRTFAQQVVVPRPVLWSPDNPRLYTAVSRVYQDEKLVDEARTPFGIRSFHFTPDSGLVFNGRPLKIKGVCLHHDLGALGAAFFEEALERRLKSLKAIGVNALRAAHNPMSPEFYDLADRMGFLVMDEAFDEWIGGKRKWAEGWNQGVAERRGYHELFEEWGVRDAQAMVLRDRNHPSIIMWSIGNEIDYPGDPFVHPRGREASDRPGPSANLMAPIARRLIAAVKELDATRPVTMALADIDASNAIGVADMLDVVGYNYLEQHYERDHQAYPRRVIYGSENSRSVAAWRTVALNDYVGGQFLWTRHELPGGSRPSSMAPTRDCSTCRGSGSAMPTSGRRYGVTSRWYMPPPGPPLRTRPAWRNGPGASGARRPSSAGAGAATRAPAYRSRSTRTATPSRCCSMAGHSASGQSRTACCLHCCGPCPTRRARWGQST
jgi:beta-galactosidase/beta-glucuronidase